MSFPPLIVPDYDITYQSGFFRILSHKKFLGFCSDIEDSNRALLLTRPPISRQEMETLYTGTVTALHAVWCEDENKGGALSKARRDEYLAMALGLVCFLVLLGGEEI